MDQVIVLDITAPKNNKYLTRDNSLLSEKLCRELVGLLP